MQVEEQEMLPAQGMQEAIPSRRSKVTEYYAVEYGVRSDDDAMVFHFYPPGTDWSQYPPKNLGVWDQDFGMHGRLERAIPAVFDPETVRATYSSVTSSFCVIVGGVGKSLDPNFYARRLFDEIDSGQH